MELFKKKEKEEKIEPYEVQENQVEEGIEFNEVTKDISEQDSFNEDSIESLNEGEVELENTDKEDE